jgi:hypothetical protein
VFDVEHFGHVADSILFDGRSSYASFDHLVGEREQLVRDIKSE